MTRQSLDVQIGLARPEDQDRLSQLYGQTYLDTYTNERMGITRQALLAFLASDSPYLPKSWQKDLLDPSKKRTVYAAKHAGEIVGMVAPVVVEGRHRITALYVDSSAQGMGVGTKLMKKALSHHGNVDVYIGVASHVFDGLQSFYESFGFRVVNPGELKRYPEDPMAYVEMVRPATD